MPVTAKLSRQFYERFGDELTNELVDWFNSVDATYQSNLREINEINFARFDAKLEQRLAGIDARIDAVEHRLNARIDVVEKRVDARIDGVEARMDTRFAEQGAKITSLISASESRMIRWMVTLWSTTIMAVLGLLIAVLRTR